MKTSNYAHASIKGACRQCGAVCATDKAYGRSFTSVTYGSELLGVVSALLCECCDNPRDPRNVIARRAAEYAADPTATEPAALLVHLSLGKTSTGADVLACAPFDREGMTVTASRLAAVTCPDCHSAAAAQTRARRF